MKREFKAIKHYTCEVFEAPDKNVHKGWCVEISCNGKELFCYGGIDTQDDAMLVGEAFVEGIKFSEGE